MSNLYLYVVRPTIEYCCNFWSRASQSISRSRQSSKEFARLSRWLHFFHSKKKSAQTKHWKIPVIQTLFQWKKKTSEKISYIPRAVLAFITLIGHAIYTDRNIIISPVYSWYESADFRRDSSQKPLTFLTHNESMHPWSLQW